jgi:ubiquinone/menaquinone biosynthesis C-methylase UbiE
LQPGQRILDVCCGSGASAIPAAEKVGRNGFVFGVDLSEKLLALARAKANEQQLPNIEFRVGDMLDLQLRDSHFDAVVCVFGIFFVPDMAAATRALWRLVRPAGKLAITTWGPRFFEPATTPFWNSIRETRPDLYKRFNPWDRISEPGSISSVLRAPGIEYAEVIAETGEHAIP